MLIPDTLFCCIKNDMGISCFEPVNMFSVRSKKCWMNYSPAKRKRLCKNISKSRKKALKNDKNLVTILSDGMKRYWNNIHAEEKEAHCEKMSAGMKKAWEEGGSEFGSRWDVKNKKAIRKVIEVPRINTYSGVITIDQLEELNA